MKEKKNLLIICIVFVVVIVLVAIAYNNLTKKYEEFISNNEIENNNNSITFFPLATDFSIYDSNDNIVKLSDYIGKPVVINFWTTWCAYCIEEMPYFNAAYNTYKDEVQFIMLNVPDELNQSKENIEKFIKQNNYNFSVYYDKDFDAVNKYSVTGYPVTIFVSKNGELVRMNQGAISQENLFKYIDLIKEK